METEERPSLDEKRFKKLVYKSDEVLSLKRTVHEFYSSVPIHLDAEMCELLDMKGQEAILDIGCGTGDFLIHLRKMQGHQGPLYGGDISSGVFNKAKVLSDLENLDIQFFVGSILRLPFPSNYFDVISAQHMLSHVPVKEALEESKRVLAKQGKFTATANSLHSYPYVSKYRKLAFEMMGWGEPIFTTTFFNLENMREALSQSWPKVTIKKLEGELKIPKNEFLKYFSANMLIWEPLPTEEETKRILHTVSEQVEQDTENGFIVEPKVVGLALCSN